MDDEYKNLLADYFTGPELIEVLDVDVLELINILEEYILEKKEEINDYINYES